MTIHVTRLGDMGDGPPPRTAAPGRVCRHAGCGTRLSVYNPRPFCTIHAHDAELPPPPPAPPGLNRCPECGLVFEWTSANFHRDAKGGPEKLHRVCKNCRNVNNRVASREAHRRARQEARDS